MSFTLMERRNKGKCFIRVVFLLLIVLLLLFFHQSQGLVHLYVICIQFLEAIALPVNLRWRKVSHGTCSVSPQTASDGRGLQKGCSVCSRMTHLGGDSKWCLDHCYSSPVKF